MTGGARLAPGHELPPYTYVPGRAPHPTRDPRGHRHGRTDADFGPPPQAAAWSGHDGWLHTLDLLNLGYYWEAHEALETWWREVDPSDPRHLLFQGLLRLAAAGVKLYEERPHGARSHAARAAALLEAAAELTGGPRPRLLGLDLRAVSSRAAALRDRILPPGIRSHEPPAPLLGMRLEPGPWPSEGTQQG